MIPMIAHTSAKLSAEEAAAVAHKVNVSEETAVRVPRALIAGLTL